VTNSRFWTQMSEPSHMSTGGINEKLLVRYLLGDLSEEQQAQVEDRAFADTGYRAALEAAEADLIDSYVRDELSSADRRAFERLFLASQQRRSKVEFARSLAKLAPQPAPKPSVWQTLAQLMSGWSPMRIAPALTMLVCVVAASWLAVRNGAMQSRVAALEASESALRRQLSQTQDQTKVRNAEATPPPVIASLVLFAGLSRAESKREQLVLAPAAQVARIDIQLESRDDYPKFRAELRTRSGGEVLTLANLPPKQNGGGYVVSFEVPASVLQSGQYELALKGLRGSTPPEDVSYSYFEVQKR
jgi:hypothetical protein